MKITFRHENCDKPMYLRYQRLPIILRRSGWMLGPLPGGDEAPGGAIGLSLKFPLGGPGGKPPPFGGKGGRAPPGGPPLGGNGGAPNMSASVAERHDE